MWGLVLLLVAPAPSGLCSKRVIYQRGQFKYTYTQARAANVGARKIFILDTPAKRVVTANSSFNQRGQLYLLFFPMCMLAELCDSEPQQILRTHSRTHKRTYTHTKLCAHQTHAHALTLPLAH